MTSTHDLSYKLSHDWALAPKLLLVHGTPLRKLIRPIILRTYVRVYYLFNSYFFIYVSIEDLYIPTIKYSSLRPSFGILSLFSYLIESSNALSITQGHNIMDKGSSKIVSVTRLIITSLLKTIIFLEM